MTADIILYDADCSCGKDQRQHVEIARDIATTFNNQYGETFVVPEVRIAEEVMTIPERMARRWASRTETLSIFSAGKRTTQADQKHRVRQHSAGRTQEPR